MKFFMFALFAISLTATSSFAEKAGGIGGGGGSDEAEMFRATALKTALQLAGDPSTARYGFQLLETLNAPLEIIVMDSLDEVCDGKAYGANYWAYSCRGRINLLQSKWGKRPKGEGYLESELQAQAQITKIIHEVFRAGNPSSRNYVTSDGSFAVTRGEILRPVLEKIERDARPAQVQPVPDQPVPMPAPTYPTQQPLNITGDYFVNLVEKSGWINGTGTFLKTVTDASYLVIHQMEGNLQVTYCKNKPYQKNRTCIANFNQVLPAMGPDKYGTKWCNIQILRNGSQFQLIYHIDYGMPGQQTVPLTKL